MDINSLTGNKTTQRRHSIQSYLEKQQDWGAQPQESRLPQQLKPTQRNSDPFKLPVGHDKWYDSNGIELGRKTTPLKCDNKNDPQIWVTYIPRVLTLTGKKLNPKWMISYKRTTTSWQKLTTYKHLTFKKDTKQIKGDKATIVPVILSSHNSAADWARELFKSSRDAECLLVSIKNW